MSLLADITLTFPTAILAVISTSALSALGAVIAWAFKQDKKSDSHHNRIEKLEKDVAADRIVADEHRNRLNTMSSDVAVMKNDVGWIRKAMEEKHK